MSNKKKIMTISDLYKFCIKNNFCHFSSSTNNEEICVQMPAIFEKEENVDKNKEGLTPFVAKAYHDHINLNNSEIKPEVLENTLPSAMLRPILASIVADEETGEKDFGSHDFVFEEDEDGNEKIKYIEQPVGVIFGDNTIEYDEEDGVNRAILHGYLYNEYCQDAVDIMNRRKTVDCSVELSIREMSFNAADKVLTLDDFYVCGLTLLGSKVKPGMKGSKVTIEDFNKSNNSMFSKYEDKMIEFQERLEKLESACSNKYHLREGGNEETMFEKLLEKYGKTVEDIDFDYENLSDEELEQKFAELFDEENPDGSEGEPSDNGEGENGSEPKGNADDGEGSDEGENPEENPDTGSYSVNPEKYSITMSDGSVKDFSLSLDEITSALYTLVNNMYADDDAWYSVTVYEDNTLIMSDWWNNKYFKQSYTRDADNFSLVGDRVAVHSVWVTDEEETALNEMRSNYASLKEFKETAEKNKLHAQKEEILNAEKYSVLAENEAFTELVKNMDNYSLTDLEKEAKVIFADHVASVGNFSLENITAKPTTVKLFGNPNSKTKPKKRYGNLFD